MPCIFCVVIVIRHIFIIAHFWFIRKFVYLSLWHVPKCFECISPRWATECSYCSCIVNWKVCKHHTGFWSLLRRRVNKVQTRNRNLVWKLPDICAQDEYECTRANRNKSAKKAEEEYQSASICMLSCDTCECRGTLEKMHLIIIMVIPDSCFVAFRLQSLLL